MDGATLNTWCVLGVFSACVMRTLCPQLVYVFSGSVQCVQCVYGVCGVCTVCGACTVCAVCTVRVQVYSACRGCAVRARCVQCVQCMYGVYNACVVCKVRVRGVYSVCRALKLQCSLGEGGS